MRKYRRTTVVFKSHPRHRMTETVTETKERYAMLSFPEFVERGHNLFDQIPFTWIRETISQEDEERLGFEPGDESGWYELLAWEAANRRWQADPKTGLFVPTIYSSTTYGHDRLPPETRKYLEQYDLPAPVQEITDPAWIPSWDRYVCRAQRERAYSLGKGRGGQPIHYQNMKSNDGYKKFPTFGSWWHERVKALRLEEKYQIGGEFVFPRFTP